jgi:hypothetical protein
MHDQTTLPPHAPAAYQAYGAPAAPAERRKSKAGLFLAIGAAGVVVIAVLVAGLFVVGRSSQKVDFTATGTKSPAGSAVPTSVAPGDAVDSTVDAAASSEDAPATVATPTAPAAPVAPAPVANNGGAKPTGGGNGGQPSAPKGPAPVITSFNTNGTVDCHNGNQQTFSFDWTTTNATSVSVTMDGAPIQTVGPNGNGSLPFNCSSAHTYTLTAHGQNGQTASKSQTLQPRNVQKPPTNDDDDATTNSIPAKPIIKK